MSTFRKFAVAIMALIVVLIVLVVAGSVFSALRAPHADPEFSHAGPTLESVRALSSLVTTKMTLADAIISQISGFTGSMSAVLVIRGDALIGIDMQQARISDKDDNTRSLVLILPQPAVIQARVDHQRTRVFALDRHGFWMLMRLDDVTKQLVDQGMREAQQTIEKAASEPANMATAREHAQQVLAAFANSAGWQLEIRWEVPPETR